MLTSMAVIVFFQRNGLDKRVWNTIIAPVLGMLGLGYALFLLITNLPALSGSDDGFVRSFPWIMLAVMLLGIGVSLGRGVEVPVGAVADEACGGEVCGIPLNPKPGLNGAPSLCCWGGYSTQPSLMGRIFQVLVCGWD